MMDAKMSAGALITIGNTAAGIVLFFTFILCILYSCITTFQDFFSCLLRVLRFSSYLFFASWRALSTRHSDEAKSRTCSIRFAREDVEIVMENLGLSWDHRANEHRPTMLQGSLVEISVDMFNEREASLDEAREAFGVFDQNHDGFVDAEELRKVMHAIGLRGFCVQDCQRMIVAYDGDGDGRIDFGEFVKLLEDALAD